MTRSPDAPPGGAPPANPPRLDYAPPTESRPGLHMCLAACVTAGAILPVAVVGPLVGGVFGLVLAPLAVIAIAAVVAVRLRVSQRTRAWAAGIWIGIGIAVLVDGACWMAISGMRFGG